MLTYIISTRNCHTQRRIKTMTVKGSQTRACRRQRPVYKLSTPELRKLQQKMEWSVEWRGSRFVVQDNMGKTVSIGPTYDLAMFNALGRVRKNDVQADP